MKKTSFFLLILSTVFYSNDSLAQQKWTVLRCVQYAQANNISVRRLDVQRRIADVTYKQNKYSVYPNANFNTSTGYQFGRSIDPTTNLFTNQQLVYQNYNLNADIMIFNWGRIKNGIISADLEAQASLQDVERNKNDIAISVATAYLQVLLNQEQVRIFEVTMEQTRTQLTDTRKRVDAGALPELNAVTLESQLALDSSTLVTAKSNVELSKLQLQALMNIDMSVPFEIETPSVDNIPLESIADLQPDLVYKIALTNQPAQKANDLRYQSLVASVKSIRGTLYPRIAGFGGLTTRFSNPNKKISSGSITGYSPGPTIVQIGPNTYPVQVPNVQVSTEKVPLGEQWSGWGTQINNFFSQNIGVSIAVPIFNGYSARSNYERAKLNIKDADLVIEQANQTLQQNIYTAYANAMAALEKNNAAKSGVVSSQKAYDFSKKRYDLGLLTTFELITAQNNLAKSKIDLTNSRFDFVFKMKVLEFYKGSGIKL